MGLLYVLLTSLFGLSQALPSLSFRDLKNFAQPYEDLCNKM
jgi:hypothetical protein